MDPNRPLAAPEERVSHMMWLSGMGIDDANGLLTLDDKTDSIILGKDYDLTHNVFNEIISTMEDFAEDIGKNGKDSLIIPMASKDPNSKTQFVLHPLGGCSMGSSSRDGVVDSMGKVFRGDTEKDVYEGLYVADGSVLPNAIGLNPSLNISALAFRTAENITGDKTYWP